MVVIFIYLSDIVNHPLMFIITCSYDIPNKVLGLLLCFVVVVVVVVDHKP